MVNQREYFPKPYIINKWNKNVTNRKPSHSYSAFLLSYTAIETLLKDLFKFWFLYLFFYESRIFSTKMIC